jgi:NitT/TauT family transport system permease protein
VLPKVAIAPLFVIWLGYGISAMVAIAVVAAFFPMMVNALVAFKGVEVGRAVMFRSLCASPWQTFWKLQVPSALPVLLSGLELSIVYSLTGTIVGEFVGGQAGLGARLLTYNATLDIAGGFAILVLLAVIGMVLQGGLNIVRRRLLFWTPSEIGRR